MDLNELASFIRVAELGTITAAAAAEGVPKSTISRRIARLEDELGVALLRRAARSFTLTDDGHVLHARTASALKELVEVQHSIAETAGVPRGRLVLSAPYDLGRTQMLAKLLTQYRASYTQVEVEVRLEDRLVDLVRDRVDVAIRAHAGEISLDGGLMARPLGAPVLAYYASSAYLERRGTPETLSELAEHDVAIHKATAARSLLLVSSDGEETSMNTAASFLVNDFGLAQRLVESGAAIALLPCFIAAEAERSGKVVRVMPRWTSQSSQLSLVWPSSRHLAPRVRAFVELAGEHLPKDDWLMPSLG